MTAQSPSAYFLSATGHALVVGALFAFALVMHENVRAPAETIQIVAGEGDNWAATEAPALGSPTGSEDIKVPNMPAMPHISDPTPEPEPVAQPPAPEPQPSKPEPVVQEPIPEPVKAAPVEKPAPPEVVKSKPSMLDGQRTTFAQEAKRIADKREARRMKEYRAKLAKEEARAAAEAKRHMTEEEFRKSQGGKAGAKGGSYSKIDAKGIAGGVVGGSTSNTKGGAGGTALSATEARLMDKYFAFLKQQLRKAYETPPGAGSNLVAVVDFHISASGQLSAVRIKTSSGNPDFDRAAVTAFAKVKSIGAPPDGNAGDYSLDFESAELND